MMQPLWSVKRLFGISLALMMLGYGLLNLRYGHQLGNQFKQWQTAKPVDGLIDISQHGRFILPFKQTCSTSHSEILSLHLPSNALQGLTIRQILTGLDAKLEITDQRSNVVEHVELATALTDDVCDGTIPLFWIKPFSNGYYVATVTVIQGAPALKAVHQRLVGHYELCGLERLPAVIASIFGMGISGVGSIIGAIILYKVARDRKKLRQGQSSAAFHDSDG
jgi:hypothetical protein